MNYIILTRNPGSNMIVAIDDDGEIAMFETEDDALACAHQQVLCKAWGYQIVEVTV